MQETGKVFFVGAGPGDPKLITVRGMETIRKADVVVYDRLAAPSLLQYAKNDAELIYCGKLPERHSIPQDEINQLLVDQAKLGKQVVRLKGGDPSIFGRVGEEAEFCAVHHISFDIVPGVTAGIAAPLYAGIPLTHRDFNTSVTMVTGHRRVDGRAAEINWSGLAQSAQTIVFYMGVANLPSIQKKLLLNGMSPAVPVALVRWGTLGEQETLAGTLIDIVEKVKKANFKSPAIIVVGEVVRLREKLAWFERKPLFNKKILFSSMSRKSCQLQESMEELGGETIVFPRTATAPVPENPEIEGVFQQLETYEGILFGHPDTVHSFFERIRERGIDIRKIRAEIAGTDEETVELLRDKGLVVREGCFRLDGIGITGKILFLHDPVSPPSPQEWELQRFDVTRVSLYFRVLRKDFELESADLAVLTSIHEVETLKWALIELEAESLIRDLPVACLGESVVNKAKQLGFRVSVAAEDAQTDKFIEGISAYLQKDLASVPRTRAIRQLG